MSGVSGHSSDDESAKRRSASGSHRVDDANSSIASVKLGDSRSIVVALQTLQEKIRRLETDRNYHQDECQRARAAHEQYKLDVERQLDSERAEHRKREAELQELITRANAERQQIQGSLDDSKRNLGDFREDLQQLLDNERQEAKGREMRLRDELDKYRQELAEARHRTETMIQSVETAKAERDVLDATNQRLEQTVKELMQMNSTLSERTRLGQRAGLERGRAEDQPKRRHETSEAPPSPQRSTQQRAPQHLLPPRVRHVDPTTIPSTSVRKRSTSGAKRRPSAHNESSTLMQPPMRFASPTMSSLNHSIDPNATLHNHSDVPRSARCTASSCNRSSSLDQRRGQSSQSRQSAVSLNSDTRIAAVDSVYSEVEVELRELNHRYKEIIAQAANNSEHNPGLSPHDLTSTLNAVMQQIDRKGEQLRLLRRTKADLAAASTSRLERAPKSARGTARLPKGFDKVTTKTHLMNELRDMIAHAEDYRV